MQIARVVFESVCVRSRVVEPGWGKRELAECFAYNAYLLTSIKVFTLIFTAYFRYIKYTTCTVPILNLHWQVGKMYNEIVTP
jgi:hypothetical protein